MRDTDKFVVEHSLTRRLAEAVGFDLSPERMERASEQMRALEEKFHGEVNVEEARKQLTGVYTLQEADAMAGLVAARGLLGSKSLKEAVPKRQFMSVVLVESGADRDGRKAALKCPSLWMQMFSEFILELCEKEGVLADPASRIALTPSVLAGIDGMLLFAKEWTQKMKNAN